MTDRDLFGNLVADGAANPARQLPLALPVTVSAKTGSGASIRFQLWSGEDGKAMGTITEALHEETAAIGRRWAHALRRRYPGAAQAKQVARDFGCEVRTAEGWLAGGSPQAKILVAAWRLHGAGIVAEVLAPGSDWQRSASVDAALAEIEGRLKDLGDELTRLRVGSGE